jgi:hypothetical protein
LGERKKSVKVKDYAIWKYIVTGAESEKFLWLKNMYPKVEYKSYRPASSSVFNS